MKTRRTRLALVPAVLLSILAAGSMASVPQAAASHPDVVPVSTGIYRVPYVDDTSVTVTNDHHTHGGDDGPKNRIDMGAGQGEQIVAAASGWVRAVVEHHGNEPGAGDNVAADGVTPQDDSLEHSCGNNDPTNTVVGGCAAHNNYVWIEHPNGEWTKYTHFGTGTVTVAVDDWVDAGDPLGLESDVGQATSDSGRAFHLHFEVAVANPPGSDLQWNELGGGIQAGASNLVPFVCDIEDNVYVQGDSYTAAPCPDNGTPTADAGDDYTVDEGSSVMLDATGSSDPDGDALVYLWHEADAILEVNLDDRRLAQPSYTGVDDGAENVTLTAYDQHLGSSDTTTVTVENVAPTVTAVGDTIDEGGTATVSATFTDPGAEDTHTKTIDWGDGSPLTLVVGQNHLENGVDHIYGDNGVFAVTVTVTDDDGGVGSDIVNVTVGNLDPTVVLDTSATVGFPGGDYFVVQAMAELPASAEASDPGSDDLTFTWSTGAATTHFNGIGPDPLPSPFGTFPFAASDQIDAVYAVPGLESLDVTVTDDDGGSDTDGGLVLVTGTATETRGAGWWKHQFSGSGAPHADSATLGGYLEVVVAASSVFSEQTPVVTMADAHEVLSPTGGDRRARAEAALLVAWLQFASGAVEWDATVPLSGGASIGLLDLLFSAEAVVLDGSATDAELLTVEQNLDRVRHAG